MRRLLRLVALSSTLLAVGCVAIMRTNKFASLPASAEAHTVAMSINVKVIDRDWTTFDLLPLGMVFYTPPPLDLDLTYVKAGRSEYKSLIIEEASIRFDDGEVMSLVEPAEPLQLEFTDATDMDGSESQSGYYRFQGAVTQIANFKVQIRGRVLLLDGTEREVDITQQVNATIKTDVQDFVSWTISV